MPPRRSPRHASKQSEDLASQPSVAATEAPNALASPSRRRQIVQVVIPIRNKKRKATTPEPAPSSPPAASGDAEEAEEEADEGDDAPEPVSMKSGRNVLSSPSRGRLIVEVVIPIRNRKRRAPTPEPAPSSPPAASDDAEEAEEEADEDDDAPEPVSMKSGRQAAEAEAQRVKDFEQSAAAKRRDGNKKRDQALKERAGAQGGSRKKRKADEVEEPAPEVGLDDAANVPLPPSDDVDDEQREADARMERAMGEADEEDEDGQDEAVQEAGDVEMDDDATAVSGEALEGPRHTRLDELDEENAAVAPAQAASIPLQLPDHIFASAAAAISEAQKKERSHKKVKKSEKVKEKEMKKRRKDAMKDRVVGSRTVRVLPSQPQPDTGVKSGVAAARFVRQRLSLTTPQNGVKKHKNPKGWERRPAHLTISQGSSGPARGFARSSK